MGLSAIGKVPVITTWHNPAFSNRVLEIQLGGFLFLRGYPSALHA